MLPDGGLTERGVCERDGIPTSRYPVYATTRGGVYDAAGVFAVDIQAERDLLLTDFIVDTEATSEDAARANVEYCNSKLLINSHVMQWQKCCTPRPSFVQGVAENKSLRIRITGGTAGDDVAVTVHGFQGNGCCG